MCTLQLQTAPHNKNALVRTRQGVRRADERRPDRKVGGAVQLGQQPRWGARARQAWELSEAHARGERERTDWRTGAGSGRWCVASREGSECACGPGGGARRYNYAHTRRSTADTERHEDGTRKARGDMQRVQSGRGRSMQVYNAPGRLAGGWAGRQGGRPAGMQCRAQEGGEGDAAGEGRCFGVAEGEGWSLSTEAPARPDTPAVTRPW